MRGIRARTALAVLGVALLTSGPFATAGPDASGPEPIEALLPADVIAVVVIREPAACRRRLEESMLGGLLRAGGEGPTRLQRRWAAARREIDRELGVPAAEVAAVARGPLALALLSLEGTPRPRPVWAVLADVGADTAPARRLIARIAAAHARQPGKAGSSPLGREPPGHELGAEWLGAERSSAGATSRPATVAQTPAILFGPTGAEAGAAVLGRHLIISNTRAGLNAVLVAVRRESGKGFLADDVIRSVRTSLNAATADAYGFVNPRLLGRVFDPEAQTRRALRPPQVERPAGADDAWALTLLGTAALDSIRAVGFAATFDAPNHHDVVVAAAGGRRGLLSQWPATGRARGLLTKVPAHVGLGLALSCDGRRLWDELDMTLRSCLDPKAYGQSHEALAELTQAIGFDVRGDLLAATGTDWVFVALAPGRPSGPPSEPAPARASAAPEPVQYALIATIRDRAGLLNCLTAFRQFVEKQPAAEGAREPAIVLKQFKLGEQVVDYLLITNRPTLSPSIALTSRHLVVTSTTTAMKRILASLGRSEQSVAADATFGALIKRVDADAPAVAAVSVAFLTHVLADSAGVAGSSSSAGVAGSSSSAGVAGSSPSAEGADRAAQAGLAFVCSARPAAPGLVIRSHGRTCLTLAAGVNLVIRLFAPPVPPPPTTRPGRAPATRPSDE